MGDTPFNTQVPCQPESSLSGTICQDALDFGHLDFVLFGASIGLALRVYCPSFDIHSQLDNLGWDSRDLDKICM